MPKAKNEAKKVIFFDLGGTLFEFHEKRFNALLGDIAGASREEVSVALQYDIGKGEYHQLWIDLETVSIGLFEFYKRVKKILKKGGILNHDFSFTDFFRIFTDRRVFELYPFSLPLIKCLNEKGLILGIISNINGVHWVILKTSYKELFNMFSVKIPSFEIRVRKPKEKIWKVALESVDERRTSPSDCIFVDDRKENVLSASKFGMKGIHFRGYVDPVEKLLSRLSYELGIDINLKLKR